MQEMNEAVYKACRAVVDEFEKNLIQNGSVVRLKSGPFNLHMTVERMWSDDQVDCIWFVDAEIRRASIPVCALLPA